MVYYWVKSLYFGYHTRGSDLASRFSIFEKASPACVKGADGIYLFLRTLLHMKKIKFLSLSLLVLVCLLAACSPADTLVQAVVAGTVNAVQGASSSIIPIATPTFVPTITCSDTPVIVTPTPSLTATPTPVSP